MTKETNSKKYILGKFTDPDAQPLNPRSSKFLVLMSETHTSMLVDGENVEAVRVPIDQSQDWDAETCLIGCR